MEQAAHEREINETTLLKEPLHLVFWSYEGTGPKADRYQLIVRATDGTGRMQTSSEQDPASDGAAGLHEVTVTVGL